jgi:hypothetical protein
MKLRRAEGDRVVFWCPGCAEAHVISVAKPGGWTFNGDMEKPTFSPSVLIRSGHFSINFKSGDSCWCTHNAENPGEPDTFKCGICHSFVEDGFIKFLKDSTHPLSGRTVRLDDETLHFGNKIK